MKIKFIILMLVVLLFSGLGVEAASFGLECEFRDNSCQTGESPLFWANEERVDDVTNLVIDSPVAMEGDSSYSKPLCCRDRNTNTYLNFSRTKIDVDTDPKIGFMFFNMDANIFSEKKKNAVLGLNYFNAAFNPDFDLSLYDYMLELKSKRYSNLDIKIMSNTQDAKYERWGYSCLFRISNHTNAVVSDCDARYDSTKKYEYTVWGKLIENIDDLKCTDRCTSVLDGRVYTDCALKLAECKNVPRECDGLLEGSWSDLGDGREVKCEREWNVFREFEKEELKVDSSDTCENLISSTYSVVLNNEMVNMRIYSCGDDN